MKLFCEQNLTLFIYILFSSFHLLKSISQPQIYPNQVNCNQTSNVNEPTIKAENLASFDCDEGDIYCLCKYHPKYRDCVCTAFPRSVVCSPTYCYENKNSYECNPIYCDNKENGNLTDCFCKSNTNHISCKCKTNPFHKDCFCMKFPLSHLCNERICKYNPNSLYCKCMYKPDDPICSPSFCYENPKDPQCECLVSPLDDNCKCINEPGNCSKEQIMDSIVNFDRRIRGLCGSNSTKLDNQTLYNQYYPPCIYENSDKENKNLVKAPCLPYPEAPKPCKKNSKTPCLDKVNEKPCIKTSFRKKKQDLRQTSLAYNVISTRSEMNRNMK